MELSVLIDNDNGHWRFHALENDFVGYGAEFAAGWAIFRQELQLLAIRQFGDIIYEGCPRASDELFAEFTERSENGTVAQEVTFTTPEAGCARLDVSVESVSVLFLKKPS